ncbi:MAG: tRNA (5-methylaminomethyl-2-thiouridine)(34)-methyltransferase MnmD [Bacteroidia bacterium]
MERKVTLTEDGSSTVFNSSLKQHYHSIHGAVQESQHVFMRMGWEFSAWPELPGEISILEIGFGTGLNAFLVLLKCTEELNRHVSYTSLEAFPLEEEEFTALNYSTALNFPDRHDKFLALHRAEWEVPTAIANGFTLLKKKIKLEDFIPEQTSFDLIFFDAFSPEAQPELWTEEIFKKLYDGMKPGGILVTYCAKGQVRRNLIATGFSVERLEGPPGKREMLRGRK